MRDFFLRYAQDFLIPMAMALVFAAVLDPITRRLRALGIPASIAAGLTVLIALFAISGSIYLVSDDITAAVEKLPALSQGLKDRAKTEQTASPGTVKKLSETAKNLEEAASTLSGEQPSPTKPAPRAEVRVEPRPSWLRAQLATGSTTVLQVVGQVLLALLITYFILASGPMLRRKLLRASGTHRNHRNHRALMRRILSQSCNQVQLYGRLGRPGGGLPGCNPAFDVAAKPNLADEPGRYFRGDHVLGMVVGPLGPVFGGTHRRDCEGDMR